MMVFPDGRMLPPDAGKYLNRTVKTLAMWRSAGVGPRFVRVYGRIFYFLADLDEFIKAGEAHSTAEARVKHRQAYKARTLEVREL